MKVLGVSGSPRREGNTELAVKTALQVLEKGGVETEFVSLAGRPIKPCLACGGCSDSPHCVQDDNDFEEILQQFLSADGIIIASPVYFGSATPEIMALVDRVGCIARRNGNLLARKVGAAIAVARRAGQNFTFAQLNFFFLISSMIVPGSTYWNVGFGLDRGELSADDEGIKTISNLAENMTWLLEKIHA